MTVNRAYRLRRRPEGDLADGDLELVSEEIPELREGQALVRNRLLSLDPTNRIWMSDIRGYMPAVPLGSVMRGLGIGEVVESKRDDMPVGALVNGFIGWQEYTLADDAQLEAPLTVLPDPLPAPESAFLGALGHTGVTAYIGIDLAELKEGETVVVSAACGAVGSIAGQIAKQKGAGRVVGIAGGPQKCAHAVDVLGYDACVDHRAGDWRQQLDAARAQVRIGDLGYEHVGLRPEPLHPRRGLAFEAGLRAPRQPVRIGGGTRRKSGSAPSFCAASIAQLGLYISSRASATRSARPSVRIASA